jgi:hypothetical protein
MICVNPPSQTDANPVCQDYTNQIQVPSASQHIVIMVPMFWTLTIPTGAEIHHPVYSLVIG